MRATDEAISEFCSALTKVTNDAIAARGDTVNSVRFETSKPHGRVYVRIIQKSGVNGVFTSDSAHCFVKVEDGTLWKAASWKGPAKNFPRGSVFDPPTREYFGRE